MPELNLDLLKNKKRTSKKYRPYDIPAPTKKDTIIEDKVRSFDSTEKEVEKPTQTRALSHNATKNTSEKPSPVTKSLHGSEIELKRKIAELEKELSKNQGKDESIPSIEPFESDNKTFNFKNKKIDNELVYRIITKTLHWTAAEKNFFIYVLEKTDHGKINDVQIGRVKIETEALNNKRDFSETRLSLVSKGVISFKFGYVGTSKKTGYFYSINLDRLLK